ncbi:hypothetical protein BH10PSE7_BH10PSE7_04620 [soil metagenome]
MGARALFFGFFICLLMNGGPVNAGEPAHELDGLIAQYAEIHGIPESLIRRVIKRESNYNPRARSRKYYGLMQISHATARSMGYRGSPTGLLDAETNLQYAGKYLAGAYLVANGNEKKAMRLYSSGYYYVAKRKGLLAEAGLKNGFTFTKRKAGAPLVLIPPQNTAVVITQKPVAGAAQKWVVIPREKPWANADAQPVMVAERKPDPVQPQTKKRRKPGDPLVIVPPAIPSNAVSQNNP